MDISLPIRREALLKAMDEVREIVAGNHWDEHEPVALVEFPEGAKPAPLDSYVLE
jgi:hypothetical protein